jgi:hypothetical protein
MVSCTFAASVTISKSSIHKDSGGIENDSTTPSRTSFLLLLEAWARSPLPNAANKVCIYMYIYSCMYIYIYIYVHVYIYIYIYVSMHTYIHTYIHFCRYWKLGPVALFPMLLIRYVFIFMYVYIYVYMYIHVYIFIYIHIYVYMYLCMHTYIHTLISVVTRSLGP